MRRFLTTLMILLVVVVAGLSALVLLVNPNDFRGYMVRQVEQRSGYQLALEGPLRWHVWPQLSILSGRMSIQAPGATQPVVMADNMRLDVALLPLLSHKLDIRQILLKGAVVQMTPDTEPKSPRNAPVAPHEKGGASRNDEEQEWVFSLARVKLADSLLVLRQGEDSSPLTVRNLQLTLAVDENKMAHIDVSSRINRDQRDLELSLSADVNLHDYPRAWSAAVNSMDYQLSGADLPPQGIAGKGTFQVQWDAATTRLGLSAIQLTAGNTNLTGSAEAALSSKPDIHTNLAFGTLDLDQLVARSPATSSDQGGNTTTAPVVPGPVIASNAPRGIFTSLPGFDAVFEMRADTVRWRGLDFTDVSTNMRNQQGLLTISHLAGKLGQGTLSLPGEIDARQATPQATFSPDIHNVALGPVLSAFNYPLALEGAISLKGAFSGSEVDADAFRKSWRGEATVSMAHSQLLGMNFQQLIMQAFARADSRITSATADDNNTLLADFTSDLSLDNGILTLDNMHGSSPVMTVTGDSTLNLVKAQSDARFMVRVTGGWKGDSQLIQTLSQTDIPLRIYGPWQSLNYSLDVNQVLKNQLQDEARSRLKAWADRNKDNSKARDVEKLLHQQ